MHKRTCTHTRTHNAWLSGHLLTVSSLSNADGPYNRSCQTGCCGGPNVRVSVAMWTNTAAAVTRCCHSLLPLAAVTCCRRCLLSQAHEESSKAVQYYSECQQMGTERAQLLTERQQMLAAAEKRASDWQALKAKYIQKSSTLKEVGCAGGFVSGVGVCVEGGQFEGLFVACQWLPLPVWVWRSRGPQAQGRHAQHRACGQVTGPRN